MFEVLAQALEVDVAVDEEHHFLWLVVTTNEAEGISGGVGMQLVCIAKDIMTEGMPFEQ